METHERGKSVRCRRRGERVLKKHKLDPRWLELEITESLLVDDMPMAIGLTALASLAATSLGRV